MNMRVVALPPRSGVTASFDAMASRMAPTSLSAAVRSPMCSSSIPPASITAVGLAIVIDEETMQAPDDLGKYSTPPLDGTALAAPIALPYDSTSS